jgi:hypothetical protein
MSTACFITATMGGTINMECSMTMIRKNKTEDII